MTKYVEVDVTVLHVTEGAVRIEDEERGECWIPRSVIDSSGIDLDMIQADTAHILTVASWFIDKEGLDHLAV